MLPLKQTQKTASALDYMMGLDKVAEEKKKKMSTAKKVGIGLAGAGLLAAGVAAAHPSARATAKGLTRYARSGMPAHQLKSMGQSAKSFVTHAKAEGALGQLGKTIAKNREAKKALVNKALANYSPAVG